MSSFYAHAPINTWYLMEGQYPLSIDLQKAPKSSLECKLCHRKTMEGEPIITVFLDGESKMNWRRTYCGLCAVKWIDQTKTALDRLRAEAEQHFKKVGENFYVAKEMFGKEARKSLKKILNDTSAPLAFPPEA